jgi:hypothetical protein
LLEDREEPRDYFTESDDFDLTFIRSIWVAHFQKYAIIVGSMWSKFHAMRC